MTTITPTIREATARFVGRFVIVAQDGYEPDAVADADAALTLIRRRDARRGGFAVTVLTWEDVPEGFTPPVLP